MVFDCKMYLKYSVIISSLLGSFLFFVGCNVANDTKNRHLDSKKSQYLYGNGSSSSLEAAKQYAIKDLVTNLQVSIKYSAKDSTTQVNNTLHTRASSDIVIESQIKDLPAIEIDKITKKDNMIFVRVRVDKNLLQAQIANRLQNNKQTLDSLLQFCQTPAFNQYKHFKHVMQDYKNDVSLYQVLSKDMLYATEELSNYQEIIDILPSYRVNIEFKGLQSYKNELKHILHAELSKFIKIDDEATKTLRVVVNDESVVMFYLNFYDCHNNIETSLQINTYMSGENIHINTQKGRIGAIIYKGIQNAYL